MEALYTATVTSIGGRNGRVKSSDGVINLELRPPKEMGGPAGNYGNPELLFGAAYSACFNGAYMHVALQKNIRIRPEVTAYVTFNKVSDGFKLSVVLEIRTVGISQEQAEELANEAHAFCPYSRAIRGNVNVVLKVIAQEK